MDDNSAEDPEIAAALARLASQDAEAARQADGALQLIADERGVAAITQENIQNFCWYVLPTKWLIDHDEHVQVAQALARALDLLELPRYAAICRSPTTADILSAYEISPAQGRAAFRRASIASGILPPDLPEFRWGPLMGVQEALAKSSAANFLEVAIAGGDLVPGARGWKARQQELVRAHLNAPQLSLLGQTYAEAITTERAGTWLNGRRSETRRKILSELANRLLHPAQLPAGTTDPLPRLRWLLEQLDGGIALTETGNLNRAFVQQSAERFGWGPGRSVRTEDDVFDLRELDDFARELGLARRSGRTLTLTTKGRRALASTDELWRVAAGGLLDQDSNFTVYAGELFLALLLEADAVALTDIVSTVQQAAAEEGFRSGRTFDVPDESDIRWVVYGTINLCRALGLLGPGSDWGDSSFGLTDVGRAVALEALRARATGPRTVPL